jgi:hypothetical protein
MLSGWDIQQLNLPPLILPIIPPTSPCLTMLTNDVIACLTSEETFVIQKLELPLRDQYEVVQLLSCDWVGGVDAFLFGKVSGCEMMLLRRTAPSPVAVQPDIHKLPFTLVASNNSALTSPLFHNELDDFFGSGSRLQSTVSMRPGYLAIAGETGRCILVDIYAERRACLLRYMRYQTSVNSRSIPVEIWRRIKTMIL